MHRLVLLSSTLSLLPSSQQAFNLYSSSSSNTPRHHPALPFHFVWFCMHSALCPSALVESLRDSALALAGGFPWNVRVFLCAWYCFGWFGFRASLSRLGACSVAGCWLESKFRDLADASMHWLGASICGLCCINSSSFDPSSIPPFFGDIACYVPPPRQNSP